MRKLIPLFGIGLLAAACVTGGASPTPGGSAGGSPTAEPTPARDYDVPSGANDLVMSIATGGGLVPPGYILTEMPDLALYGDGRVVVPGPIAEIYPGPLLPNLRVMRLTPAEIQKILAAADQVGLLGPDARYDATGITDLGTTVFTTVEGGKVHRISAYALMKDATADDPAVEAMRAKLMTFEGKVFGLSEFLGRAVDDTEAYEPAAMRVFVSEATAADQPLPTAQTLAWPLAADPMATGEATSFPDLVCVLLGGADLTSFVEVATTANAQTVWTYGTGRYSVRVRPLFPHESGCGGSTP
jgi:hypothetical protein